MTEDTFLGEPLPARSILDADDYREMYEAATSLSTMALLSHLDVHGPEKPASLQRAFSDVLMRLTQLQRVGLVQKRTTGHYDITSIGSRVVEHGAKEGVRRCMQNEWEFEQRYS